LAAYDVRIGVPFYGGGSLLEMCGVVGVDRLVRDHVDLYRRLVSSLT